MSVIKRLIVVVTVVADYHNFIVYDKMYDMMYTWMYRRMINNLNGYGIDMTCKIKYKYTIV